MELSRRLSVMFWLFTGLLCGCSTVRVDTQLPLALPRQSPDRCLCLWQQAEGQTPDGRTTRGFAGQVYFFSSDSEAPMTVRGQVQVYLFDDHGTPEEQTRPIYQAGFDSAEWESMLHESQLGPVYSLFVPYPRPGDFEANCTLRIRLTGDDGTRVFSELTRIKLTGKPRPQSNTQVHTIDPRLEHQWTGGQTPEHQQPALESTTIGIRRGDRLLAASRPESSSSAPEESQLQPEPNEDASARSRVQYYEDKLRRMMLQRRTGRVPPGSGSDIQQTSHHEAPAPATTRENPFLDFQEQ